MYFWPCAFSGEHSILWSVSHQWLYNNISVLVIQSKVDADAFLRMLIARIFFKA
jgi:hypothetical protein